MHLMLYGFELHVASFSSLYFCVVVFFLRNRLNIYDLAENLEETTVPQNTYLAVKTLRVLVFQVMFIM